MDLHGYFPIVVDESLLSAEEKAEALRRGGNQLGDVEQKRHWDQLLTAEERAERQALRSGQTGGSAYRLDVAARSLPDEFRFRRLGMLRQYARDKYGNGQPVVYGDHCLEKVSL